MSGNFRRSVVVKAVLTVCCFMNVAALRAEDAVKLYDFKSDGLYYRIVDDGNVIVSPEYLEIIDGQDVYTTSLVDPLVRIANHVYDYEAGMDYNVIGIAPHAFEGTGIESLEMELPDSYICDSYMIDDYAFYNCKRLKWINIPRGVTYIGNSAFEGCERLKYVGLLNDTMMGTSSQDHNLSICGKAFYNTPALEYIFIGNGMYSFDTLSGYMPIENGRNIMCYVPQGCSSHDFGSNGCTEYIYGIMSTPHVKYGDMSYEAPEPEFTCGVNSGDFSSKLVPVGGVHVDNVGRYEWIVRVAFRSKVWMYEGFSFEVSMPYDFVVDPAVLTVKVEDCTREYGQPNPEFVITTTGFVNGDNAESVFMMAPRVVNGMDEWLPAMPDEKSPVGEYWIVAMASLNNENYRIEYVNGLMTVTPSSQSLELAPLDDISNARVYVKDGYIIIENLPETMPITVVSLEGVSIYNGFQRIIQLPKGLYIVKAGKTVSKVMI